MPSSLCRNIGHAKYNLGIVISIGRKHTRGYIVTRTSIAFLASTLLAGTLDILSAFMFSGFNGVSPAAVLRSVAAGPFGSSMRNGELVAATIGLGVHFAIMAAMVGVYVLAAGRIRWLVDQPLFAGILYGIALYLIMYWFVLPLRWPTAFPMTELWSVSKALFSHIVCVGIPIAIIAARNFRAENPANVE